MTHETKQLSTKNKSGAMMTLYFSLTFFSLLWFAAMCNKVKCATGFAAQAGHTQYSLLTTPAGDGLVHVKAQEYSQEFGYSKN